jgi:integrase
MAVFKRKYTAKNGKAKAIRKYSVDVRDHDGVVRRVPAFTDRSASVELERQLKKLVALRMAGAGPDAELSRFLESCPGEIRESLGKWGIISIQRVKGGKPLAELVDSWGVHLQARQLGETHCRESVANVMRVLRETKTVYWSDLSAEIVEKWLTSFRKGGASNRTSNSYLAKLKTFANWAVRTGVVSSNPLIMLGKLNEAADSRLERHPSSIEDLGLLLATAEAGDIVHGMTGPDRALLYRTAVETGLRWSECRSLTRASFDFESASATVTIRAEDAKNGKQETLPLRPELAADLKTRMAMFLPAAKAFPGMWAGKGAEMIRTDLEAAGILSRDANGDLITVDEYGLSYDFHGLRHTFATLGAKAGIPLAVMQKLMRHSDPKLTAGIYTHVLVADKADELAKLPEIAAIVTTKKEAATGTYDAALESDKIVVMPIDSFGKDAMANIKTYIDDGNNRNAIVSAMAGNEKSPVPQGQTGPSIHGGRHRVRTCDLLLVRRIGGDCNVF